MTFEHYIYSGTKRLRCGYTTGSCAALAAKAATKMLLEQRRIELESITTPSGLSVSVDVLDADISANRASCAVKKDAGDDIDATDGLLVYATVRHSDQVGISIEGGRGVGRVTMPGLDQPVGEAAINTVPREMIAEEVQAVAESFAHTGGFAVEISVPEGEQASEKTFNSNLGIVGGISILGTTGIVEPRSLSALKDSIELEIKQNAELGHRNLIITFGNYGTSFVQERLDGLGETGAPMVSCANFVGGTLDFAAQYGFERVLLVGHIGKMVKLAGGIMDTHSRVADCRTELICTHAALAGADTDVCRKLYGAVTTDACLEILQQIDTAFPLFDKVMTSLGEAIHYHVERRVGEAFTSGAIMFSNQFGELYRTDNVSDLLRSMKLTELLDAERDDA